MLSGFFYAKYFQSLIHLLTFEIAEKGGYFFSCWGINKGNQVQGTLRCLQQFLMWKITCFGRLSQVQFCEILDQFCSENPGIYS